jgi:hypothetical protein
MELKKLKNMNTIEFAGNQAKNCGFRYCSPLSDHLFFTKKSSRDHPINIAFSYLTPVFIFFNFFMLEFDTVEADRCLQVRRTPCEYKGFHRAGPARRLAERPGGTVLF